MSKVKIIDLNRKYTISLIWIGGGKANVEVFTRKTYHLDNIVDAIKEIAKHELPVKNDLKAVAICLYDFENYIGYELEEAEKALVFKHFLKDSLPVIGCLRLNVKENEFDKDIIDRFFEDINNQTYVNPKRNITMIFPTDDGCPNEVNENECLEYYFPNLPLNFHSKKEIKKFEKTVAHNFHMAVRSCTKHNTLDEYDFRFHYDDILTLKIELEYLNGSKFNFERNFRIFDLILILNKEENVENLENPLRAKNYPILYYKKNGVYPNDEEDM